jgi:hypothetical protein
MAEQVDLAIPVVRPALTTTSVRVAQLWLDVERGAVVVHLRGTNGELTEIRYEGAPAAAMLRALNTANLSTRSLQARILDRLIQDGHLAGVVSGTPD